MPGLCAVNGGVQKRAVVAWRKQAGMARIRNHMAPNQEATARNPAPARTLEATVRRRPAPGQVTVFTGARAAISRVASDEPGPGLRHALKARKCIAQLRAAGLGVRSSVVPSHEGYESSPESAPLTSSTAAKLLSLEAPRHARSSPHSWPLSRLTFFTLTMPTVAALTHLRRSHSRRSRPQYV